MQICRIFQAFKMKATVITWQTKSGDGLAAEFHDRFIVHKHEKLLLDFVVIELGIFGFVRYSVCTKHSSIYPVIEKVTIATGIFLD